MICFYDIYSIYSIYHDVPALGIIGAPSGILASRLLRHFFWAFFCARVVDFLLGDEEEVASFLFGLVGDSGVPWETIGVGTFVSTAATDDTSQATSGVA